MKLSIPTSELKTALTGLAKVISTKASLPILSHVRLDVEGRTVSLTGTSIDQVATFEIELGEPVSSPVAVLIPLDALQAVLKTAQGPSIEIEPGKDAVTITATVAGQSIGRRV
jgi:DNA polymerase III sliding clamp (beta) subunit (PCNA family)